MAKDPNFDIPVQGSSYSGSSRAKAAVKSAGSGSPITPDTSGTPNATQTDNNIKDGSANLKQDSNPRVLDSNTKPIAGGTPPNNVNSDGRPGDGASGWPKKNNRGQ